MNKSNNLLNDKGVDKVANALTDSNNFKDISQLDSKILDEKGFYCIRLKEKSELPTRYQEILESRVYKYIYIGKAERSIKKRLDQELEHKSPGTFFRSIGCVLGYLPMRGHLAGKVNQNNFKFSKSDTEKIIDWLRRNIEVSIVAYDDNFNSIEGMLIKKYTPLLNVSKNPLKLKELVEDRKRCKKIAGE